MKILCPTDLYEAAANATTYAAKIAQATGSTLTLINVQVLADLSVSEALYGERMNVGVAESTLESLAQDISKTFRISCSCIVSSSVAGLIKEITNESTGFDLVVMGTEGPDGIQEMILGSKAYQVAQKASIPVLIVPMNCGYSEIRNISFAFDYWKVDPVPMTQVIRFASWFHADLSILQILETYTRKSEKEMNAKAARIVKNYKNTLDIHFKTIYDSDKEDALRQYFASGKVDVIVMHSANHSFWEKLFNRQLIKEISNNLSFPLLVVHR